MCTLIVLNECIDGYPLVVAANRDERYDRRSKSPEMHKMGDLEVIRPWDDERDGTWIGVAQDGWFVSLTNQDDGHHDEHALSRGKVIVECLCAGMHAIAARALTHVDPSRYNPFNIVFGRPCAMFLTRVMPGNELEMQPLPVGVNVISNDCWGTRYDNKVQQATLLSKRVIEQAKTIGEVTTGLFKVLGDHSTSRMLGDQSGEAECDPFQSLCVHAEEHAFGTRSSSIITVSSQGNVEYLYSEGHPCSSAGLTSVGRLEREKTR